MASNNAERQAAYRRKRRVIADTDSEKRLDTWVSYGTLLALERLARHYSTTQRAILQEAVLEKDQAVMSKLRRGSPEWNAYFGVTR
jgi:hypothetical protein